MPIQISILDLLHTSPMYKEILDSSLHESHVPIDINAIEFCNLVGHLFTLCALSFKTTDIPEVEPNHTLPLCITIMVSYFSIKRVMIDNGSALNIYTLKFIKQASYTEANIINKVITIKAYDNLERTTEGTILLPIRVGPATQEKNCHVFDLNLPFNILLGHLWIHGQPRRMLNGKLRSTTWKTISRVAGPTLMGNKIVPSIVLSRLS